MPVWRNCTSVVIYFDETVASDGGALIVEIENGRIQVSYDDDEGPVHYRGVDHGNGHFELNSPERKGKATLHQFPNGGILEGYWEEDSWRGMWRIFLRDDPGS